jgi:MYXO-CTERM domain-containing protein
MFDNQASGISLYRIDGGGPASGNLIINNTIIVGDKGRWAINIQNGSRGNRVINNILLNRHRYRGSVNISADSLPDYQADHNVVMERFTTDDGDSRMDLAEWRKKTGQDAHSVIATPAELFVDEVDFALKPGSPAIDAGAAVPLQLTDRLGVSRPVGAGVDIGAHEQCPGGKCATSARPTVKPSVAADEVPEPARETKPDKPAGKSGCQSCSTGGGRGGALAALVILLAVARIRSKTRS